MLATGPDGADTAYPNSHYTYYMYVPFEYSPPSFYWEVPSGWSIINGQGTNAVYVLTGPMGSGGALEVDITACGITKPVYKYVEIGYGSMWPDAVPPEYSRFALKVTPNPTRDQALVTLEKTDASTKDNPSFIREVQVTDKMGSIKKQLRFSNGQRN